MTNRIRRLTELSLLHISNTFRNILAVPKKAVFCITPTMNGIPSFPIQLSNHLVTPPRAPFPTGTTSTILSFHNLPISLFKSWYFFHFFPFFFPYFHLSYRCSALHSLSFWPVPVRHITMLLSQSSDHIWITIAKFYSYQHSLTFP